MNGRAAAPTAQARPPYSMNGWAPRRQGACSAPFYEWGAGGRLAASRGERIRLSLAVCVSPLPPPSFIYLFFCEWRAGGDSCARTAPSARPEGNGGSGRGGGGGGSGTPVPLGAERGWGQPSCSGCGPVAVVPHPHLLLLVHSSCVLCWQHRCEKARKS